jgi:AbrB family looped-hinge helix DNA binding protein
MAVVSISPRYRITIPRSVREEIGLKAGDKIAFLRKGEELVIVKVPSKPLQAMAGKLQTKRDVRSTIKKLKKEDGAEEKRRGV